MKCPQFAFFLAVATCCLLAVYTNAERKRYDNYHVYQVTPSDVQKLAVLKQLESSSESYIFLSAVHYINSKINVVVAPEQVAEFQQTLQRARITFELLEENAQSQLEDDEVADPNRRTNDYTWEEYHTLNDTYNWLYTLEAKYPKNVKVIEVGESYEGRKILGIKISYGAGRKAIFLEGGMHAREWIGPATVTYIANELLTSEDKNARVIAQSFDWYILPHANPDGFSYTHTNERLWRKTRQPYGKCWGADPNRNWDFHWMATGASDNPCSDTYGGPAAFSEPETRSLSEYITTLKGNLFLYLSLHSYSQLLLFPYGHTNELPENYDDLKRVMDVAITAAAKRYGTKYTGGNVYDAIYPAAGASQDWVYGTLGAKFSYCYELRPSGLNFWTGFRLPAAQIIPTAEETFDSIRAMIAEIGIEKFF